MQPGPSTGRQADMPSMEPDLAASQEKIKDKKIKHKEANDTSGLTEVKKHRGISYVTKNASLS